MAVFTENLTKLRAECDQAQEARHQFYEQMRSGVQQSAEETRSRLRVFRAELNEIRAELHEKGNRVRENLKQLSTDLQTGGKIFRGSLMRG